MDILTTVGFAISGFVLVLLTIFMVGFKIKTPEAETVLKMESIKYEQWKDSIPTLIIKHYKSLYKTEGMPVINTVLVKGRARYRISNLWMPVVYHTWIENRTGFLRELDFYWYGKVILKGVDFWIKGIGALQVNGVIRMNETGKNVTESQFINFLAESLLLGTFDFSHEQIKWDQVNENAISLTVYSRDAEAGVVHTIDIYFDNDTGRIKCISSERYRGQLENRRIPWTLHVKKWHEKDGKWVPDYHAKWEDQKKPWCRYTIDGIYINGDPKVVRDKINKIPISKYRTEVNIHKRINKKQSNKEK